MATIVKTIEIDAPAADVWDAVADFGAVHRRFAPGFVTNVELEPGARLVTFGDGTVARELFLGRDDAHCRLAYSVQSERLTHHNASFQVTDLGGGKCRLTWTADVLPNAFEGYLSERMEAGIAVAGETLGRIPA